MDKKEKAEIILRELDSLYHKTETFLHYSSDWQLLFSIILSAQATDKSVNEATKRLFDEYDSLEKYTEENRLGILDCISKVGLGNSKSINLIKTARILLEEYDGKIPRDREKLQKLPGVGYKTSGVFLAEFYSDPYIPVDTHILRVTHRLGIVPEKYDATKTEIALEKMFDIGNRRIDLHRQLILFGRNICHPRNPECNICPLSSFCKEKRKNNKTPSC